MPPISKDLQGTLAVSPPNNLTLWRRRQDKNKNRRRLSGQSRGNHQDQGQVNCHNDSTYTSDHDTGIPHSPASSAPAPAPRMRSGAAHNPGVNTLARQRGTFRNGNRQLEGGPAPSTTLPGGTSYDFRRCSCSVASLSNNAAQIASVKRPRAPSPSADDSHGVIPAAGTSASSVVSSSHVFFFCFFLRRERALPATFSSVMVWVRRREPRFQRRFPQPRHKLGKGVTRFKRRPRQPRHKSLRFAHPPQARVAQQYSCGDGASPFYANVFIPHSP